MRRRMLTSLVAIPMLMVSAGGCGGDNAGDALSTTTTEKPVERTDQPCTDCRSGSQLRLVGWCNLQQGVAPVPVDVSIAEETRMSLEECPQVPEMIGLAEQDAIDSLNEVGWPNRVIYRDAPLDYAENKMASRISLIVIDGEVVDARWI